jgi:hypothetical protein
MEKLTTKESIFIEDLNEIEIWKDISEYEGFYKISNLGRVKSIERKSYISNENISKINGRILKEKILKGGMASSGYLTVSLFKNGNHESHTIHKLVAIVFKNHKPCGHKLVVNHINFDRSDNRAVNLEITTQRKNTNKKHLKSSSKYIGVYWCTQSKKWRSRIRINNKRKYLGLFKTELEASEAYQKELKKILENGKDNS